MRQGARFYVKRGLCGAHNKGTKECFGAPRDCAGDPFRREGSELGCVWAEQQSGARAYG